MYGEKINKKDVLAETGNTGYQRKKDSGKRVWQDVRVQAASAVQQEPIQCMPISGKVFRDTKKVKLSEGSIFNSKTVEDVRGNEVITVESALALWSRLGPYRDLEDKKRYAKRPHKYEWLPMMIDGGVTDWYIREGTFDPLASHLEFRNLGVVGELNIMRENGDDIDPERRPVHAGLAFEHAVEQYIRDRHEGYFVVKGLQIRGQAELDFVVFQGPDIIIYSAKLQFGQFKPKIDGKHWDTIKGACYDEDGKRKEAAPEGLEQWDEIKEYLPLNEGDLHEPEIRAITLDKFKKEDGEGMTTEDFLIAAGYGMEA